MRACLDCLPCLARNATELARRSARGDATLEGRIAAEGMRILGAAAEAGYALPPPCYARQLIDNALAMCGGAVPDPWAEEKKRSTELALKLMERMDEIPGWENNPEAARVPLPRTAPSLRGSGTLAASLSDFEKRLRLAIAGNILDFSIYADLDIAAAMETMKEAFTKPICGTRVREATGVSLPRNGAHLRGSGTLAASSADAQERVPPGEIVVELKRRMDEAKSILWIFDNCGEAVFDRLLMEPYREKITLAVRGKPAFNDMTRAELAESGYPEGYAAGGVVSNDDGVPGVVDATCGAAFRAAFASADLIIAKGQANFETMSARTDKPIAFLFLAKCPVVCRAVGAEPKTIQVLLHGCEDVVK